MSAVYPSELACKALRLQPTGSPYAGESCACLMCGRPVHEGDIAAPTDWSQSFADYHMLGRSGVRCGWCVSTTVQDTMRALQRCVVTPHGIYNLGKDEARAWFWLTPPEPPYVVVINHSTMGAFHYFWRTPVTLDNRLVHMNLDGQVFKVRRDAVLKGIELSRLLIQKSTELGDKKAVLKSPFRVLLRDGTGRNHGVIHDGTAPLAEKFPECKEALAYLRTLSRGELVAMSSVIKAKPVPPVKPELITSAA